MLTPSISTLLKYANIQMAAEARIDLFTEFDSALLYGNDRSSKFPSTLAQEFVATWEVAAHQANTGTGFSGTVFENRETNEHVISFRSTGFVDDAGLQGD